MAIPAVRYCSTIDVNIFGQVEWQQLGFVDKDAYNNWMHGTLIYKAMDFVDNYCRHNFQDNMGTIYVDGRNRETVHVTSAGVKTEWPDAYSEFPVGLLPIPLMRVTGITIDTVAQTAAQVAANFRTYNTHVAYTDSCFNEGRQNVVLTARFGYGTIPHDIQYVTAQLCSNMLADMVRRRMLVDLITPIMEGGGDIGILFRSPKVLTNNEKEILNKYRYHPAEITRR